MDEKEQGLVMPAGQGRQMQFGPNHQTVKVSAESGSHQLGIFESVLPPGGGVFAHLHGHYEEAFYVLEGEIEYRLGERRGRAGPGSWVFVPAEVVHGFQNVGSGNARHIAIVSPAAALDMIEELGKVRPEQMAEVMAKYDSKLIEQ